MVTSQAIKEVETSVEDYKKNRIFRNTFINKITRKFKNNPGAFYKMIFLYQVSLTQDKKKDQKIKWDLLKGNNLKKALTKAIY